MSKEKIVVRKAVMADIPQLEKLEDQIWTKAEIDTFGKDYFLTWLEVFPEGFLIAESGNTVVGYLIYQKVDYDWTYIKRPFNEATDRGLIRRTHNPDGDCFYGVSICSKVSGAGSALRLDWIKEGVRQNMKGAFAFSRIPGFAEYLEEVKSANQELQLNTETETEIALWYALEIVMMGQGKVGKIHLSKRDFFMPPIKKRDKVAEVQLGHPFSEFLGVIPNYLKDAESRNFAALQFFPNPMYSTAKM